MADEISNLMNQSKDKSVLLRLRNNKTVKGDLVDFDVHMNLTLNDAEDVSEESHVKLGKILLRGDNILAIFIQPWIVDDEDSLKEVNLAEFDRAEGGPDFLRFADPRAQTKEVPLPIWEGKASDDPDPEVRRAIPVKEKIHNALFD